MQKHSAAGNLSALHGIGNGNLALAYEPHVAVHSAVIAEVESRLFLAWRIVLVVAVVGLHCNDVLLAGLHSQFAQVDDYRQIAAKMLGHLLSVEPDGLFAHDSLEI